MSARPIPRPMPRAALVAAALGVAVFLAMAVAAGTRALPGPVDAGAQAVLLGAVGGEGRVPLVVWVTWLGNNDTLVALVVALALAFVAQRRAAWALRLVAASGGGALVLTALKMFFARARPLPTVVEAATGWSFPSGHAFASTVFYGMVVAFAWRSTERRDVRWLVAALGALVVLAVGLSRVVLGVHYLSDVVAGWGAGVAWLVASQALASAMLARMRRA